MKTPNKKYRLEIYHTNPSNDPESFLIPIFSISLGNFLEDARLYTLRLDDIILSGEIIMQPSSRVPSAAQSSLNSLRQGHRQTWLYLLIGVLGGVLIPGCLVLVGVLIFFPQWRTVLVGSAESPMPAPPCGQPMLALGSSVLRIEDLQRAGDGAIVVPPGQPGVAYWIAGTSPHYVFALSPTEENLTLISSLQAGQEAIIRWANCDSSTYTLLGPGTLATGGLEPLEQSGSGITVFVSSGASISNPIVQGELVVENVRGEETPSAGEADMMAEITLLDTSVSEDGSSILISITILNTGDAPFDISAQDVSLTVDNALPLAPVTSEPVLPCEVNPGTSVTISFAFSRLAPGPAVFRLFDVEFDVE